MTTLTRGQRTAIPKSSHPLQVRLDLASNMTIDLACFGLDAAGKLSDERYMVFFNQPASPCGALQLVNGTTFGVLLGDLPASIDRLVFTAAIDGAGAMRELRASQFTVTGIGIEPMDCAFSGDDFAGERALMVLEVYRKDADWRLNTVLQGFNEGLDALVRHFGGEVDEHAPAAAPAAAPTPPAKISLEKKVAERAPELVSLAKKATISLEKAGVSAVKARVVLVLDASGSMNSQYKHGRVQELVDRMIPLAVNFDDDGTLECWAFGDYPQRLSPVGLHNFRNYIEQDSRGWRNWELGSRINTEWRVIEQVIGYARESGDRTPVYVLFISDGGIHDSSRITRLIKDAATLPIFWQFVGLAGSRYGILEKLDDMTGRVVDNCNFFALDDLREISEEALYDRLMEEFPGWLKEAKAKGIIA